MATYIKKKHGQSLGKFKLKKIEQEILLAAAKAHTNLSLNKKKVNINFMNIDLLERQVETDQNRLEKGEIGLTDLAQSESSLSGAKAALIAAQNDLVTSRANFEKIIGNKPSENIQDTKFNHYALQLSLYRYLLEQYYGFNVSSHYIVHLKDEECTGIITDYKKNEIIGMVETLEK